MEINLTHIHHIHFVGIKGVAMTALALVAAEMGKKITGSDVGEIFPTDATLAHAHIPVSIDFTPAHITDDIDLVIYTGAHGGMNNNEVVTAIEKKIPTLPHGKALGIFMQGKRQISVAGSHGKTTTSSLMASLLTHMDEDPSFAVGCGEITDLKTSGHSGTSDWFVAEADEYVTDPTADKTPRFLWQHPHILIITNIDFDHPDVYADVSAVESAFMQLTNNVSSDGFIVYNADDPRSRRVAQNSRKKIISYGKTAHADFYYHSVGFETGTTKFSVTSHGKIVGEFTLHVSGLHNVANATAAIASLLTAGFAVEKIQQALPLFLGTKRRFERITQKNDKALYDDYAHHPTEIMATLSGARAWYPKSSIIAIFQPHTYTRTKALLSEFTRSFGDADLILISEIYASARERVDPDFSAQILAEEIKKMGSEVKWLPTCADVLQYLHRNSKPNDVIITMGAGDIYSWLPQISEVL